MNCECQTTPRPVGIPRTGSREGQEAVDCLTPTHRGQRGLRAHSLGLSVEYRETAALTVLTGRTPIEAFDVFVQPRVPVSSVRARCCTHDPDRLYKKGATGS